jgi:hypothetical protein
MVNGLQEELKSCLVDVQRVSRKAHLDAAVVDDLPNSRSCSGQPNKPGPAVRREQVGHHGDVQSRSGGLAQCSKAKPEAIAPCDDVFQMTPPTEGLEHLRRLEAIPASEPAGHPQSRSLEVTPIDDFRADSVGDLNVVLSRPLIAPGCGPQFRGSRLPLPSRHEHQRSQRRPPSCHQTSPRFEGITCR